MAYQAPHSLHETYPSGYIDSPTTDSSLDPTFSSYSYQSIAYGYGSPSSTYDVNGQPLGQSWSSWHALQTQPLLPAYTDYWSKTSLDYGGHGMLSNDDIMTPKSDESEPKPTKNTSKKFKCDYEGCSSAFARKADRDRHKFCVHNKDTSEKKDCPEESCTRKGEHGFTRTDHLTEHLRNFHHRDIERRRRGRPRSKDRNEIPGTGL